MTQSISSKAERLLGRLEKILAERNDPQGDLQRWLRVLKRGLKPASVIYLFALIGLLWLTDRVGERFWPLTPVLYLPPQIWLLPLLVLTPLCLYFNWRLCGWHVAAVIWLFCFHMGFRWSAWPVPASPSLKIMTVNLGQRKTRTLYEFVQTEQPDVIALQEARPATVRALASENFAYHLAGKNEFVLASRFPIKSVRPVPSGFFGAKLVAARFELDFQGRSIAVYVVHMPTPRPEFIRLRGHGFLGSLVRGGGIYSHEVRRAYAAYWEERIELVKNLLEDFRREPEPFLVVGDFNMPDCGHIYRLFRKQLTDTFAAKGRGYGLTFPGVTRNPLSLFGPWLRLDYVFSGTGWRPVKCRVEPRQPVQHRVVVATLEFAEPN